jgi:arylsulfatase A-like enzyme
MPARATIATGHYPHAHGLWDNRQIPVRQEGLPFLITDLKRNGYQTVGIGKMHFHPFQADYDYDLRISLEGKDVAHRDDDYEHYLAERGTSRRQIKALEGDGPLKLPRGQSFFDWPLDEELHADAFVGRKTHETIRNDSLAKDKPWFTWVSFTGPHNPWNAPQRLADIYRNMNDLPTGDFVAGELNSKPLDYTRHRYGYGGNLFAVYDQASEEEKLQIRRGIRVGHYAHLSFIDEWLGKIVKELDEKGQLENTLVIFTSDHGSALFDNEMLHKGSSFPTQSMVPFVVWQPGVVKPGIRNHFSSHADLYATFMELAGEENPTPTEGKSLVRMLLSADAKVHDFTVVESTLVTSIITERWLAGFHHITRETELYDLQADPMCHDNIADVPENADLIGRLRQQLVDWRRSLVSPGERIGEDPLQWDGELGDPAIVEQYRNGYLKQFTRLIDLDESRPGKTGRAAARILGYGE